MDADIEKFFDNVNQDKLMVLIEQRISDRRILKLIRQWLKSGVLYGNILIISELGTSQGSAISPLLANIYLNTLDRLWEKYGLTHGTLVRYADDTVIICKNKKSAKHAWNLLRYIMGKLDLKLHPVKTKIVSMWDGKEGFDFLGMHHRRMTIETSKGQKNMYYQVNATYFSALGESEQKLLMARAIQIFMPGKPQIWYLDLFAGKNDHEAVKRAGASGHKEINRTNLTSDEIKDALKREVVRKQIEMIRFRNICKAFGEGAKISIGEKDGILRITWSKNGFRADLRVDFINGGYEIKENK